MNRVRAGMMALAVGMLCALAACNAKLPTSDQILDSKLFDRRVDESPRQRTLRECQQEVDRFRVKCTHCHTTEVELEIKSPDSLKLTQIGKRAHIMRTSPTFGLHNQCTSCHRSEFALNEYAQRMFGPDGAKHKKLEEEMNKPVQ